MKHLKTFSQLNEGFVESDPKKEFEKQFNLVFDISKAIITGFYTPEILKEINKEKPEIVKAFKGYFNLSNKAQKILKKIKPLGLSKDKRKAAKQLKALTELASSLKEGFDALKTFKKKTDKGLKSNEGIGTVVGNTLRNVLTGQFIINLLKNLKSNLLDSEAELHTVQDVFDIKDY